MRNWNSFLFRYDLCASYIFFSLSSGSSFWLFCLSSPYNVVHLFSKCTNTPVSTKHMFLFTICSTCVFIRFHAIFAFILNALNTNSSEMMWILGASLFLHRYQVHYALRFTLVSDHAIQLSRNFYSRRLFTLR